MRNNACKLDILLKRTGNSPTQWISTKNKPIELSVESGAKCDHLQGAELHHSDVPALKGHVDGSHRDGQQEVAVDEVEAVQVLYLAEELNSLNQAEWGLLESYHQ